MAFNKEFLDYLKEIEGKEQNLKHLDPESPEIHKLQILARISERDEKKSKSEAMEEFKRKEAIKNKRKESLIKARQKREKKKDEAKKEVFIWRDLSEKEKRLRRNKLQKERRHRIARMNLAKETERLEKLKGKTVK